jgi:hypothetical protein
MGGKEKASAVLSILHTRGENHALRLPCRARLNTVKAELINHIIIIYTAHIRRRLPGIRR